VATKSGEVLGLILPDAKELQQLPKFAEAAGELAVLNDEVTQIEQKVRETKVVDRASFEVVDALNKRAKEIVKAAEGIVEPYKSPLRRWLDLVQTQFNVVKNHCEQLKGIAQPKLDIYSREEARAAQAEQEKIQKDLNKQYRGVPKAEIPTVEVKPEVRSGRTYYYAECEDKKVFLRFVFEQLRKKNDSVLDFVEISSSKLTEKANEIKDDKKMAIAYPGVKAWNKKVF
jgi:hypothetical protein